jgi:hypothetical protein
VGVAYDGIPGDIAFPAALAIATSTNTTPITVTTSSPHGMLNGARVAIYNHQTNTAANGVWTITRTGANSMTLNGSASAFAGGATGTVQPLTYGAAGTIPSDGDNDSASTFNAAYVPLFDRSSVIVPTLGNAKLAGRVSFAQQSLAGTGWASLSATLTAATPTAMTLSSLAAALTAPANSSIAIKSAAGPYSISGMLNGDFARATLKTTFAQSSAIANLYVLLFYAVAAPGAAAPAFGSYAQVQTASCQVGYGSGVAGTPVPVFTHGWTSASLGLGGADMYFQPVMYALAGGAVTVSLLNDALLEIEVWRPTGVPQ